MDIQRQKGTLPKEGKRAFRQAGTGPSERKVDMKKFIAVLLACVMLFSVAFAFPMNFSIMPRAGIIYNFNVIISIGVLHT